MADGSGENIGAQLQDDIAGHTRRKPLADEVKGPGGDTQEADAQG